MVVVVVDDVVSVAVYGREAHSLVMAEEQAQNCLQMYLHLFSFEG